MDADVVVAGAGPVGLMTACELALQGVAVVVLEQLREPGDESRAQVLHGRTIPVLDQRGLLGRFTAAERGLNGGGGRSHDKRALPKGHFAGITGLDFAGPGGGLPAAVFVPQAVTTRLLADRAAELGVDVRRGARVTGAEQDADGVTVLLADGTRVRARYAVGCDGARSAVREAAGIGFSGTASTLSTTAGEVLLGDPPNAPAGWQRTPRGCTVMSVHPGGGRSRVVAIEFSGPPRDREAPVTVEELSATVARIHGRAVPMTGLEAGARYGDAARLADAYRSGRILLAGDAAHIHYPVGGQGLNIGLQDAVNLGWKLAEVLRRQAPEALLDSYESERRPVAAAVLMHTRAQIALLAPDPRVDALREMFTELIGFDQVNRYLAEKISATDIRYDMGPDAMGPEDAHPLVGRFVPPVELTVDGARRPLSGLLHTGRSVLLALDGDVDRLTSAAHAAAGRQARLDVVPGRCPELSGLAALLVRPDGYVAWAAGTGLPAEQFRQGLDAALRRWLGDESRATH
ncbi:FAD-dependent monooxygenase [Streptomyces roseoverticillatus]|uniref:FAD-dependent monooxygenase n=1 Tax=Streptomyces roseoverticillatus TaxID=66429 RepID=A0ABV3J265_9ACTN